MTLRFFGFLALAIFALSAMPATNVMAEGTPPAGSVLGRLATSAYGPNGVEIVNLKDLDTFSYKLHRELTGAAGQRVYGVFKDGFVDLQGFIPAKFPANGRFSFDWEGDYERPDRFLQVLTIGSNDWFEWGVSGKYKGRYNDDALLNLTERRNEVLFWWNSMTEWLDAYGDSLQCASTTKLVNDEQAVRCLAPTLSANGKISLLNVLGMFTNEETQSVSALTFELWLTKNDDIPVRLDVSSTAVDVKGNSFSGRFTLDVLYIDSADIQVDLPR
jgi:hypothetical protein